eukprot:Rmarinus@m.29220
MRCTVAKFLPKRARTYETTKTVRIDDPALAGTYWALVFSVIVLYTGLYQCLYQHAYAQFEDIRPTWAIWAATWQNADAEPPQPGIGMDFCDVNNTYFWWPSSVMTEEEYRFSGGYVNEGTATCIDVDTSRHVSINSASLSFATFDFVGGPDNVTVGHEGQPRFYVRGVETIAFGTLPALSVSWLPEAVLADHTEVSPHHKTPATSVFSKYEPVSMLVGDALAIAGISLDEKNLFNVVQESTAETSPTFRFTGVRLAMVFSCSNLRPFDLLHYGEVWCDIAVRRIPGEVWGVMGTKVISSPPTRPSDPWSPHSARVDQNGVIVSYEMVGAFGRVSFTSIIRLLVETFVLLRVCTKVVNVAAERVLPGREAFALAKTEQATLRVFTPGGGMGGAYIGAHCSGSECDDAGRRSRSSSDHCGIGGSGGSRTNDGEYRLLGNVIGGDGTSGSSCHRQSGIMRQNSFLQIISDNQNHAHGVRVSLEGSSPNRGCHEATGQHPQQPLDPAYP